MFALNGAMGRYDELTVGDIYNDPEMNPMPDKLGIHAKLEKVYGL